MIKLALAKLSCSSSSSSSCHGLFWSLVFGLLANNTSILMAEEKEMEEVQEKVYPAPQHSHEEVVRERLVFMDTLRRFHSSMATKFM